MRSARYWPLLVCSQLAFLPACGGGSECEGRGCDDASAGSTYTAGLTLGGTSSTSSGDEGNEETTSDGGTSSGGESTSETSETSESSDTSTTDPSTSSDTSSSETSTTDPSTSSSDTSTTTSTSTSTSTSTTGETDGDTDGCGKTDFDFEVIPPNVMLVLDKSGSMMTEWDDNGTMVTRWNTLYNVVSTTVTTLDADVNFGAKLFPEATLFGGCTVAAGVEVPAATMNSAAILAALPAATATVSGGTPATAGLTAALEHLKTLPDTNPRAMILVTDGAANCVGGSTNDYDPNFNTTVANAFSVDEVPTYVVGIDIQPGVMDPQSGVILYDQLNDVAVKGGVPKTDPNNPNERFYNATDGAALQTALDEISGKLKSCVVPLDSPPPRPDLVKIWVDGMEISQVTDCATENGWVYVNPTGPYDAIELCGTACEQLKITGTLTGEYGCPPPV